MPDPDTSAVPPLRIHQREALEALARAWDDAGHPRAWVVLPPGAGKTRVGLEAVAGELRAHSDTRAVVLAPNTAIQSQWIAEARTLGLDASDDKSLSSPLTCLTYQSLAVFDSEAADDDDSTTPVVDRLHPNGVALFDRIRAQTRLVLVLDECHHLLEVWGRLLVELLDAVGRAHVLALTATPPESLAGDQRALVDQLFGSIRYRVSVPAVVKEGHLAPFDELVWLTTPTPTEEDWLTSEALRFTELTTLLTTPGFGSVGFYEWLTTRFVEPVPATTTWAALAEREPDLCDAALRMHHAGLLDLPVGARLREEHRHAPSAEDWVRLLGDWLLHHVAESADPADAEVARGGEGRAAVGGLPVDASRRTSRALHRRPRAGPVVRQARRRRPDHRCRARRRSASGPVCWCCATTSARPRPCRSPWTGSSTPRPVRRSRHSRRC